MRGAAGVVAALLALLAESHVASASSQLRQVIVLSRHGVRGPYGLGEELPTRATLSKYARNPSLELPLDAASWGTAESGDDPAATVSPKLTKHGFNVVKLMGEVRGELSTVARERGMLTAADTPL